MPLLSIVIPVYNRIDILIKNIKKMLEYEYGDIEIVICDDCSDEPIKNAVLSLNDNRVKYYRNDVNVGIDNYYYSLKMATGKYAWLTSYRDVIDKNGITQCIKLLYENEPDLLLVSGRNCYKYNDVICCGDVAVYKFYTCFMYGTGIIYKRSRINFDKYVKNYGYEVWDQYPQTFLANDIIKTGIIETSSMELFERFDYYTENKFTWYNENKPFYPELQARIHLLNCYINDLLIDGSESHRYSMYSLLLYLRFLEWVITYINFIKNLSGNHIFSLDLKLLLYKRFVDLRILDYIDFLRKARKQIFGSIEKSSLKLSVVKVKIYSKIIVRLIHFFIKMIVLNITKMHISKQIVRICKATT